MKNKKFFLMFTALLALGALTISYSLSIAKQPSTDIPDMTEAPTSTKSANLQAGMVATSDPNRKRELIIGEGVPNTSEASEIISTIERAYYIEVEAGRTNDLSKFHTVFINDLRFDLPPKWLKVVRKVTGNLSLEKAGFLEYKIAYFNLMRAEFLDNEARRALRPYTPEPSATVPPGTILVLHSPPSFDN